MNRRLLVQVTCVFILGILFGTKRIWILPLILAGLILCVFIEHMQKRHRLRGVMKCMLLAGTFLLSTERLENEEKFRAAYENRLVDDDRTTIQGTVYKKESKNHNNLYYLNNSFIILESETVPCNRILVYLDTDEYQIGKTLIIEGKTKLLEEPGNEGQFDARRYYQNQKIDFIFYGERITAQHGQAKKLDNALYLLKNKIRRVYENNCSAEDAGVLATMVLGDKSILDSDLKQLYQESGISHILAISGLHISVIGMAVYRRLRKRRAGFLASGMITGILVYLYCTLSGMGTSSGRAFGMCLLLVTAPVFLRTYDSLTAMGITALLLLWKNPFMLYDSGFQFSYCAVLGVVVVGGRMVSCMKKRKPQEDRHVCDNFLEKLKRRREGLCETVLISLGIQMMTLPLTLWNYYEFPLYSVLINLVILPFVGIVLGGGILGGVIGLWCALPAKLPLLVSHLILGGYHLICEVVGVVPGSVVVTGRPKLEWILVYYMVLFVFCVLMECRKKLILTAVAVPFVLMLLSGKEKGFEVDVLDVGQGDGIFLSSEDNRAFFIDGGSTDVKNAGKYRILPFLKYKGRGKIDYWFVSHTDADHCNGLAEIMENGYRVDNLVFSDKVPDDDSLRELISVAEKNHTNVRYMTRGDSLRTESMKITCIYPDESSEETDKNALSMVLMVSDGNFKGLFTGDISENEETKLAGVKEIENLNFYKSAHHGSGTSNSEELLENVSPQVAVVSCGLNNSYGHPAPEAVMRMEKSGAEVYYTMWGGQISIWMNEDELCVQNYRSPLEVHTYPMLK